MQHEKTWTRFLTGSNQGAKVPKFEQAQKHLFFWMIKNTINGPSCWQADLILQLTINSGAAQVSKVHLWHYHLPNIFIHTVCSASMKSSRHVYLKWKHIHNKSSNCCSYIIVMFLQFSCCAHFDMITNWTLANNNPPPPSVDLSTFLYLYTFFLQQFFIEGNVESWNLSTSTQETVRMLNLINKITSKKD